MKRKEKKLKEKLDDIKVELEEKKDEGKTEENKENGSNVMNDISNK